jgi:alpha-ribazole phosphatase
MVTYKLHLIRHGMTEGNRDGRYVGRTDLPVCPEGIQELAMLRRRYVYPEAREVYCSPLQRCRQTADLLYPDHPLTLVEDLVELSLGDFEGRYIRDLKELPEYRAWLANSLRNRPPGALESGEQFGQRIATALHHIFMNMTQNAVTEAAVVTHGGVIMGLLSTFALPRLPMREWAVANGSGYTLRMSTALWMRDRVVEVAGAIPRGFAAGGDRRVIDSLCGEE